MMRIAGLDLLVLAVFTFRAFAGYQEKEDTPPEKEQKPEAPAPAMDYQLAIQKIADADTLLVYQLTLETSSRHKLVLSMSSNRDELSFGPPSKGKDAVPANITVVVYLVPPSTGKQSHLLAIAHVEDKFGNGTVHRLLPVPSDKKLPALLRQKLQPEKAPFTGVLLRAQSEGKFLQVAIE